MHKWCIDRYVSLSGDLQGILGMKLAAVINSPTWRPNFVEV